jgi:UDP-N-acetyl-2-amino-2-deoxyglucuronate dehydrogenase
MITVAIIGCGVIAPTHAKALAIDGRASITWACDTDVAKARERIPEAKRHTTDYREALADPNLQAVCICTPHADHAQPLADAIAAGKHVICEKPLGVTPEQVQAMVASAKRGEEAGLVVAGIFQHRFNPLVARLQSLIAAGDFGKIRSAKMDFRCTRKPSYYAAGAWRGTWAGEGGALLINQAIHTIDIVNFFCGEAVSVRGKAERRHLDCIECEDHAEFTVRYRGGHEANFFATNDGESGWVTDVHVECERGSFSLGKGSYALTALQHPSAVLCADIRAHDQLRDRIVALDDNGAKAEYGDFHAVQITDALSAMITGRRPRFTVADASASVQVVLGVYHASVTGGEVALPVTGYQHPIFSTPTVPSRK